MGILASRTKIASLRDSDVPANTNPQVGFDIHHDGNMNRRNARNPSSCPPTYQYGNHHRQTLSSSPGKSLPYPLLARHPSAFIAQWRQRQVLATIIFFPFPLFIMSVSSHISVRGPGKRSHYRCSQGLTFCQFSKCEHCFSAWNGSFVS